MDRAAASVLVLVAAALTAAKAVVCPRVAMTLESGFSRMPLAPLGISTGTTWCANGYAVVCPRGMTLERWLAVPRASVEAALTSYLNKTSVPRGFSGTFTLDMEDPVSPKNLWQYADNRTQLRRVAAAFAMRASVARAALPRASIAVYGMPVSECGVAPANRSCWARQQAAMQAAAALGMLDDVDTAVPVWYTGAGMSTSVVFGRARASLGCAMALRRSDGSRPAVSPFLSYRTFPQGTAMAPDVGRQLVQLASNGSVTAADCPGLTGARASQPASPATDQPPLVQFWAGSDNATFAVPWFEQAAVVPALCLAAT